MKIQFRSAHRRKVLFLYIFIDSLFSSTALREVGLLSLKI